MSESVWDSIYNGIKDFAGDENKVNALIGGGIGAGIGGLIDGWRGAGIGAVGGGIAGYKSNDIKNWWNTPQKARNVLGDGEGVWYMIAAGLMDERLTVKQLYDMDTEDRNKFFSRYGISASRYPYANSILDDELIKSPQDIEIVKLNLYRRIHNQ